MRILITNDDGINAPGLEVLTAIATEIAGPKGEVWTVAPAFEQSGVGHCISYTHPMMIAELGPKRFAAEGSPADCVLAAIYDVLDGARPDLVLSGVNRGNNAAENVLYSGTIGGAMEAALQGVPAIALSQFFGPGNVVLDDPFESARVHGAGGHPRASGPWGLDQGRLPRLLQRELPAPLRRRYQGHPGRAAGLPPRHRLQRRAAHVPLGPPIPVDQGRPAAHAHAARHRCGSEPRRLHRVTPMRADLTAHDLIADLEARLA
jgi:5'-nucleotidase